MPVLVLVLVQVLVQVQVQVLVLVLVLVLVQVLVLVPTLMQQPVDLTSEQQRSGTIELGRDVYQVDVGLERRGTKQ